MSDLISRQAVIDEFYKHPNIRWTTLDVMEKIDKLPSAQPEIIRCKDCKYKQGSVCEYSAVYVHPNGFCNWGTRKGEEE